MSSGMSGSSVSVLLELQATAGYCCWLLLLLLLLLLLCCCRCLL